MISTRRVLLLCALIFLLYASTLAQGFHFDDYHMVTENQFIKSWGSLSRMAITPFISSASTVKGMYRPVLMATFCWNYQTGALNPFGFHLVNVWLHLIVVCLVVGLSRRLWPSLRPLWILLAASVWAVHPIHTEAVAYISSRSSILAALFVVLALWLYAAARQSPGRRRWGLFIGSLLAYGLALGSKEIAVTLPGLLFLVEWKLTQCQAPWCQAPRCLAPFRRLAPFFLLTALYLVWRKLLIGAVGVVYPVRPWRENTLMQLEGISSYLKLWLWPVNQTVVHPQPAGHGAGPWLGLGMLVGLGILAWGVRRRWPGLTFALGWAGVTFLPPAFASSLNLVVAEHHLYLPSVGFALGLPQMLEALSSPRRACPRPDRGRGSSLTLIALALTLVLSVATFRRNLVWADDFTLWVDAARKNPMSCMVHNNLGLEYEKRGELEDALRHYRGALHLARDLFDESTVRNNLGNLYLLVKQPEEAMAQFRRCLEILPWGPADFYNNIGLAYLDLGDLRKAEESYVRSLDANRLYVPAYMNLGVLRFRQARWEEGGRLFEQAVRLDPDDALAMLGLGKFYLSMGEFDKASETFRRLVRLRPNEPTGYLYLAVCAMRTAPPQLEAAHRYLARATALGWEPDAAFLAELKKIGK